MANSKFEYVRNFEQPDPILPNTWIVVRIDGRGFHKLSAKYGFEKPNDRRALDLMNAAAEGVVKEVQDLIFAYGQSDEYSFVFHKSSDLFHRRKSKLVTTVVSTFTSYYVHLWPSFLPGTHLSSPLPSFDARAVLYPGVENLRDYLSWRQADCHVNNLYNTTFWALVNRGGLSAQVAEKELMGTFAPDKNEILFSRFGINYNNEPEIYRKGSCLFRDYTEESFTAPTSPSSQRSAVPSKIGAANRDQSKRPNSVATTSTTSTVLSKTQQENERKRKMKSRVIVQHVDIIREDFWELRPWILEGRAPPER